MSIIKNLFHHRPLSWVALVVREEKRKQKEQQEYDAWTKTNDYKHHFRCIPWQEANGDSTLRVNYDLNERSVVFDLGGYHGDFAVTMFCKYNCEVYVFEPVPEFYNIIQSKFSNNPRVHPYRFGLSDKDSFEEISLTDVSSSIFIHDGPTTKIELKDIVRFLKNEKIEKVDLIKINIEGAEYDLLDSLLDNGMITMFKNLQIQFHDFIVDNASERMKKIQERLSKTHRLTYQYEFVWENWEIK